MARKTFDVPTDIIVDFAEVLEEFELDNSIEGVTEDGEIIVLVDYSKNEKEAVAMLQDLIDDYEEEEEEDEDEDDDE